MFTQNSPDRAAELNRIHPAPNSRFRIPEPKPVSTIMQNPRPRSHEKPVTKPRRICDPTRQNPAKGKSRHSDRNWQNLVGIATSPTDSCS